MAVRGRRPKPTHLKLLEGNPGKRPLNADEPIPAGDLAFDPPEGLSESQEKLWRSTMKDAPLGLLKNLDRELFRTWVIATDTYHRAVTALNASPSLMVRTRNGEWIQNPYLAIVNKQALLMHKAGEQMGFSPSARTRVTVGSGAPDAGNKFGKFANK